MLDVPFAIPARLRPVTFAAGIFDSPKPSPLKMPDVESMFPVATTFAPVVIFPPDTLPVAATTPAVVKFPPITLPVTSTTPPDVKLPPSTLPVTVKSTNVPKDVTFG